MPSTLHGGPSLLRHSKRQWCTSSNWLIAFVTCCLLTLAGSSALYSPECLPMTPSRCCWVAAVPAAVVDAGAGRIAVAAGPVRDWCLEYGEHPAVWIMTEVAWCVVAGVQACRVAHQQLLACACILPLPTLHPCMLCMVCRLASAWVFALYLTLISFKSLRGCLCDCE